ncbi:hypothetical protein KTH11_18765, partial [Acinetobacter baumannii]|nr:hypothetical protein [Acinetobacter baumannii]
YTGIVTLIAPKELIANTNVLILITGTPPTWIKIFLQIHNKNDANFKKLEKQSNFGDYFLSSFK